MQSLGHPIFNDFEYGGDKIRVGPNTQHYKSFIEKGFAFLPGQALHAKTLGFIHPEKKAKYDFDSELNEGFKNLLNHWETYSIGY
jgi:23S rRNA pseudouridine1911/1915/1917 synthase